MASGMPAVQSLVKNGATKVPSRFIRPIDARPGTATVLHHEELPIIDASRLNEEAELEKLYKACTEWGFFQLIGHDFPPSLLQSTREVIRGFFDLPEQEKEKYIAVLENTREGYVKYFIPSEESVLDWGDLFFHFLPPATISWPVHPPEYRATMEGYASRILPLATKLLASLSTALHQPPEFFFEAFGSKPRAGLRMNCYPPCPEPDLVLGLSPHSDGSGITILLQDEIEGLQIKRNGMWKGVESIPDAFVVNIGDILEIMSNGTYKSVEHRAVVSFGGTRISAALFYSPPPDIVLRPLIGQENPKFKEMPLSEFMEFYLTKELRGKDHLEFASVKS